MRHLLDDRIVGGCSKRKEGMIARSRHLFVPFEKESPIDKNKYTAVGNAGLSAATPDYP